MPLKDYGVHVGYPISFKAERDNGSPHLQLLYSNSPNLTGPSFRAAINIKSSTIETRLVYWFIRNFNHPITTQLTPLAPGFHEKNPTTRFPAIDFIRSNFFDLATGSILRHNVEGEDNDLIDFISPVLTEVIKRKAVVYIFGQKFPGGIHDVHMNQGNEGRFAKDNGVWQDGGILLHFEDDGHWEGVFLAFAVQKVHTDDGDGSPIGSLDFVGLIERVVTPPPIRTEGIIQIRGALLNPIGHDPTPTGDPEKVYLVNRTAHDIDLNRWTIVNKNGDRQVCDNVLKGNEEKGFLVPDCPLSNQGGTISLLDNNGLKVDGVSYSKAQAKREGVLVMFH